MKRKIIAILLCLFTSFSIMGCGKEEEVVSEEELTISNELKQNDYRGGLLRALSLKDSVMKIVDDMKANNKVIREDNPNSYWVSKNYQDFVNTMLTIPIIDDTQWFNEEETKWEDIITQMGKVKSTFTVEEDGNYSLDRSITIKRNEKDDYSVIGANDTMSSIISMPVGSNYNNSESRANYRILYDCDKDWCQAYSSVNVFATLKPFTSQLFEYRHINDNVYVIQTSTERLLIELKPTDVDTDIRNRSVKEFYYSKLADGKRSEFRPFESLKETDENGIINAGNMTLNENMLQYPYLNEKGDYAFRYGTNDSVFIKNSYDLTREWVFEDKALQQAMSYKNGVFSVITYNKLAHKYEQFIYSLESAGSSTVEEIEKIVDIKSLTGDNK